MKISQKLPSFLFGLFLALLWGGHSTGSNLPGSKYLHIASFLSIVTLIAIRLLIRRRGVLGGGFRCGAPAGWACWLLAATFSTIINIKTPEVLTAYFAVFIVGTAVYLLFDGTIITSSELEIGVLGLAIGALVPLLGGLQALSAFVEWGNLRSMVDVFKDETTMLNYEDVTFGSRSNTAPFVVMIAPVFLWVALDRSRTWLIRAVSGLMLIPIVVNLIVLEVRAAWLVFVLETAVVWYFKLGVRRFWLFLVGCGVIAALLVSFAPTETADVSDRIAPAVTVDTSADESVGGRVDAIAEGIDIALQNWLFGIGPNGALTRHSQTSAHQLMVQQFMETGILGLIGTTVFFGGIMAILAQTLLRRREGGINNLRFTMIIGPASYIIYSFVANGPLNIGYVNVWTILMMSMLALSPPLHRRRRDCAVAGNRAEAPDRDANGDRQPLPDPEPIA